MRKSSGTRSGRIETDDRPVDEPSPASLELSELRHRTDNLLQTIQGLLSLEARRAEGAETKERLHGLSLRVDLLAQLHRRLNVLGAGGEVDAGTLIRDSATAIIAPDDGKIALELDVARLPLGGRQAQSLGLLVHEAVTNVARHAFRAGQSGRVVVRARGTAGAGFVVAIEDNGRGMQPTAGAEGQASGGLGLRLMRSLALSIGGGLNIEDGNPGLKLTVRVPPSEPTTHGRREGRRPGGRRNSPGRAGSAPIANGRGTLPPAPVQPAIRTPPLSTGTPPQT